MDQRSCSLKWSALSSWRLLKESAGRRDLSLSGEGLVFADQSLSVGSNRDYCQWQLSQSMYLSLLAVISRLYDRPTTRVCAPLYVASEGTNVRTSNSDLGQKGPFLRSA